MDACVCGGINLTPSVNFVDASLREGGFGVEISRIKWRLS